MKLIVATRGSSLALAQTESACLFLKNTMPDVDFSLSIIHTAGDKDRKTPLHQMSSNGVFIKEVEEVGVREKAPHSRIGKPTQSFAAAMSRAYRTPRQSTRGCQRERKGCDLMSERSG